MSDFTAYKRSQNAEEGAKKFFQTTNRIVDHFKRDLDRKLLKSISGDKNTLTNLLASSSAVHIFDYEGIKTMTAEDLTSDVDASSKIDPLQRKELFNEIRKLTGSAISTELELENLSIAYEEEILETMLAGEQSINDNFMNNFKDKIELNLISALNTYPTVHFFDHIGNLTGYSSEVKSEILSKTAELKSTSIDLEIDLIKEDQGDKYIELSTFNLMVEKMKKDFEFSSIKDLKMETFPIKKMITSVINHQFNLYPISKRGLECYKEAGGLKKAIYREFAHAEQNEISYLDLEKTVLGLIVSKMKEFAKKGPNFFVYFLKNLLEMNFEDVYDLLARFGIANLTQFCDIQYIDIEKFMYDSKVNQLDKMSFMKLAGTYNDFHQVEAKLNEMKAKNLCVTEKSVEEILLTQKQHEINYLKEACRMAEVKFDDLKDLFQKKKIVEMLVQRKTPLKWIGGYAMLYDLNNIYKNISRFIYFTFFGRICVQIARVLETYIKLKEDKPLFLLGLKRIFSIGEGEEWVGVKIEEYMIQRIMNRQSELAVVFNAENNAYLVNSFIMARLLDISFDSAKKSLTTEAAKLYQGLSDLPLLSELISPISYVIAYEILERLKEHQVNYELGRKEQTRKREEEEEERIEVLAEEQKKNTLNWIDKKIISSLMSVTRQINPTQLYWSENDQKLAINSIKLHSELSDQHICPKCGADTSEKSCIDHPGQSILAYPVDLFAQFYIFALNQIKKEVPKTKIPTYLELYSEVTDKVKSTMFPRIKIVNSAKDSNQMIDGERYEVAKWIAESIGGYLDKAIYKKFKKALKNNQ